VVVILSRGCAAGCNGVMDLVFVLDSAGTVYPDRWHYMQDFVQCIVEQLDVAADRTRVAVVYWSDSAHVGFTLNQYFVRQVRSVASNIPTISIYSTLRSTQFLPVY